MFCEYISTYDLGFQFYESLIWNLAESQIRVESDASVRAPQCNSKNNPIVGNQVCSALHEQKFRTEQFIINDPRSPFGFAPPHPLELE